ncbi:MAG: ACP S-malonyltransferase, partial [Planctomycetes bacterium]|nr:ACP S-malonyltransferase [Planctomycetota bacterium]
MSRPRTLVICPGRGSYAAQELGTLTRRRAVPGAGRILDDLLPRADAMRRESELLGLAELDSASRFQASKHLPGPNAGPMIAFCSMVDRKLIPEDRYEVIGVLGNSMGWYTSLEAAGALGFEDAFRLIQTMSSSQGDKILGGQMIVPFVDENWRLDARRRDEILTVVRDARLETDAAFVSIELGGYLVVAGDDSALRIFEEELPKSKIGNHEYPFRLAFHAAFHTPLMIEASRYGRAMLSHLDWRKPQYPLVDGSGR